MSSVRIFGIDPGFDRLGVCVIDKNNSIETLVYSACLVTKRNESFERRLLFIGNELKKLFAKYKPNELAIEKIFFAKNQSTAINVAEVRGVCLYLATLNKMSVHEYSPPQIKLAIAGHGQATKKDILHMIPKILKKQMSSDLLDDELDAIAIALTHSSHRQMKVLK